jgi:hypothetical protein
MNLKKLLLICLLSLSLPAFAQQAEGLSADWVAASSDATYSSYLNLKSITVDGSKATVWEARVDMKQNNSQKTMLEFNCKTNQFRVLSTLLYTNTKFSDLKKSDNNPSSWVHIPPDSYVGDVRDIICKLK